MNIKTSTSSTINFYQQVSTIINFNFRVAQLQETNCASATSCSSGGSKNFFSGTDRSHLPRLTPATNVGYGGPGNEALNARRGADLKENFNVRKETLTATWRRKKSSPTWLILGGSDRLPGSYLGGIINQLSPQWHHFASDEHDQNDRHDAEAQWMFPQYA